MTDHTPDALASALPPAISYEIATNVYWDRYVVAQVQAQKLAESGYVLVHLEALARDEAVIDHLAEAVEPFMFDGRPDEQVSPATRWGRNDARKRARAMLVALRNTPTTPQEGNDV